MYAAKLAVRGAQTRLIPLRPGEPGSLVGVVSLLPSYSTMTCTVDETAPGTWTDRRDMCADEIAANFLIGSTEPDLAARVIPASRLLATVLKS